MGDMKERQRSVSKRGQISGLNEREIQTCIVLVY